MKEVIDFLDENIPIVYIVVIGALLGALIIAGTAVDQWNTRKMSSAGFCYRWQDIQNTSGDHWTWEKCK